HHALHASPTRRSSDLATAAFPEGLACRSPLRTRTIQPCTERLSLVCDGGSAWMRVGVGLVAAVLCLELASAADARVSLSVKPSLDRKSTRLNSSHVKI